MLYLFFINQSLGQQTVVEAVYYDPLEPPYKIEKKYVDYDGIIYTSSNNHNDVCVKIQTSMSGDTTLISQMSYAVFNKNYRPL